MTGLKNWPLKSNFILKPSKSKFNFPSVKPENG